MFDDSNLTLSIFWVRYLNELNNFKLILISTILLIKESLLDFYQYKVVLYWDFANDLKNRNRDQYK